MKIKVDELREKIEALLQRGFSAEEATTIADYIVWAEMTDNKTQGIIKLTGDEPLQNIKPDGKVEIERDTKLSRLINGNKNPAPLVASIATDVVIEKAKAHGFAIVGARNTFSSNGAQGYYAEKIARDDLIGIVMSRSPGSVAVFGSVDPLLGTNPIGVSFPTLDKPLVFDAATSAMTFYGAIIADIKGEKLPDGMAIDENGNPTTDPKLVVSGKGAILPFDGSYKGAGFGMIVELMTGPLINSAYLDYQTFDKEWGSTFIAIDPELLTNIDEFKRKVSDFISIIKSSRKNPHAESIRLPGEKAQKQYAEALKTGEVDVDEKVFEQIK
jgi:LDH2 family malate/lactate/ureidoglycolate dehydrogenase